MAWFENVEADFPGLIKGVPLTSLAESDCIAAIERATQLIVGEPEGEDFARGLFVRFNMPDRILFEDAFYEHVRTKCPGAVPALRALIEKFTELWSWEYHSGGIFAAYALAYLDESSLPLVQRHFQVIDAEHNAEFGGEKVQTLVTRHGFTSRMVDFVITWLQLTENTQFPGTEGRGSSVYNDEISPDWWITGGLRNAAKAHMGGGGFRTALS